MATLDQRRTWRQDALLALYELTNGSTSSSSTLGEIAELAGIPEDEVYDVVHYLQDESLAEITTFGGLGASVDISAFGVRSAEELHDGGAKPPRAIAAFTDVELRIELEPVLHAIDAAVDDLDLDPEDEVDVRADLQSATDQLRAARPNRGVIKAALSRIVPVMHAAAVGGGVIQGLDVILRRLGV